MTKRLLSIATVVTGMLTSGQAEEEILSGSWTFSKTIEVK